MDFISNLIKRPISVVLNESNETTSANANETNDTRPASPSKLIAAAMNTSINTELTDLLESAAQDLVRIEEKNKELPPLPVTPASITPDITADTIKQLLNEINKNLDEVSCDDNDDVVAHFDTNSAAVIQQHNTNINNTNINNTIISTNNNNNNNNNNHNNNNDNNDNIQIEHDIINAQTEIYQELSPMATKSRLSMPQTQQDSHIQQRNGGGSLPMSFNANKSAGSIFNEKPNNPDINYVETGVNKNCTKFVGLTEFDESQIPELPGALNPDLDAHLKDITGDSDFSVANMNSTLLQPNKKLNMLRVEHDVEYASDSEIFVECQSLNSEKCSNADKSELDTYRSAINDDDVENSANATLEKIVQETEYPKLPGDVIEPTINAMHDISCEPMDVDMNETLEIHEKISTEAIATATVEEYESKNVLQNVEIPTASSSGYVTPAPEMPLGEIANDEAIVIGVQPMNLEKAEIETDNTAVNPGENVQTANTESVNIIKTLEQIDSGVDVRNEKQLNVSNMKESYTAESLKTNLTLDMTGSFSSFKSSAPTSPTFPLKSTSGFKQFPRSPNAPPESKEMQFLEKCLEHEISDTNQLQMPTGIQIVPPSPEKIENETGVGGVSLIVREEISSPNAMLNGTFDSGATPQKEEPTKQVDNVDAANSLNSSTRLTFSVPKQSVADAETDSTTTAGEYNMKLPTEPELGFERRRTFSLSQATPLSASGQQGATFSVNTQLEAANNEKSDKETTSFPMGNSKSRRTFNMPTEIESTFAASNNAIELDNNLKPRRTFNMLPDTENTTFAASNDAIELDNNLKPRRTFNMLPDTENNTFAPPQHTAVPSVGINFDDNPPTAFPVQNLKPRRTFNMPPSPPHTSPAVEATEAMDIDVSMQEIDQTPKRSISPPIPTLQKKQLEGTVQPTTASFAPHSPPIPTHQQSQGNTTEIGTMLPPRTLSPPLPTLLKRRPIHDPFSAATNIEQELSAKEQAQAEDKDEKDIAIEQLSNASAMEEIFSAPQSTSSTLSTFATNLTDARSSNDEDEFFDAEFQNNTNLILNPSDFDYLLTKGNNNAPVDRSSLLLKFDPLLGTPVPVNQVAHQHQQQQQSQSQQVQQQELLQIFGGNTNTQQQQQQQQIQRALSPTIEENEHSFNTETQQQKQEKQQKQDQFEEQQKQLQHQAQRERRRSVITKATTTNTATASANIRDIPVIKKCNATMSVDVLDNDTNRTFENRNSQTEENLNIYNKMDDLEKKIKNEVHKSEDYEKKLRDYEQREENLVKRLSEKEKIVTKMNSVIEAYEKAIAELIAEKEKINQDHEMQLNEIKADRDSNYQHLMSLETTFSDLHVKYEKSKEMTAQLKSNEESLIADKKQLMENLRMQEQRYEKMKNHAMQQLEIANKKLETLTKEHAVELTKLKALLKKEEISRASITEQLQQKTRENAELVKICDELINGQGS